MEKSYLDLTVDWVKLDPSRLLQVLINLITNAIKFTQSESRRTLVVSIGASRQRPDGSSTDVKYFPSRSKRADLCSDTSEWGSGETLYLHFAVQDTGRGLSHDEKNILFQRFTQASPRTHVQYGGSGLGLFISREYVDSSTISDLQFEMTDGDSQTYRTARWGDRCRVGERRWQHICFLHSKSKNEYAGRYSYCYLD